MKRIIYFISSVSWIGLIHTWSFPDFLNLLASLLLQSESFEWLALFSFIAVSFKLKVSPSSLFRLESSIKGINWCSKKLYNFYWNLNDPFVRVLLADENRSKIPFPGSSSGSSGDERSDVDARFFFNISSRSPSGFPSPFDWLIL